MTLVDVCGNCDTMFDAGEEHCRRCGADRSDAIKREMRDMCYTYTGEEPEDDEIARMVKPTFIPKWGKPQWYEMGDGEEAHEGDAHDGGAPDEDKVPSEGTEDPEGNDG